MLIAVFRLAFTVGGLAGGWLVSNVLNWDAEFGLSDTYVIFLFVILGGSMGYVLGGILGRESQSLFDRLMSGLREVATIDVILGTTGLVVGLIVAYLGSLPLRLLEPRPLAVGLTVAVFVVLASMGIAVARTRRREMALVFPQLAGGARATGGAFAILDTSAVIDGRFATLAPLGLFPGELRVPRFVLAELQTLADSADDIKRARGRRGLDLLATLPEDRAVPVLERDFPEFSQVDDKLLQLALQSHATLVTLDYNLARVATVRGVRVLNLNEIAAALRPNFLPGDRLRIRLAKAGKEAGQGVGHLEDGTMVVVADGAAYLGRDVDTEVTSVIQTTGGRMIFAQLDGDAIPAPEVPSADSDEGFGRASESSDK